MWRTPSAAKCVGMLIRGEHRQYALKKGKGKLEHKGREHVHVAFLARDRSMQECGYLLLMSQLNIIL